MGNRRSQADGQVGRMEPLGAKMKGDPKRADSLGCRMTMTEAICSFQKAKGRRLRGAGNPEIVVRAYFSRGADGCPRTVCPSMGYLHPSLGS